MSKRGFYLFICKYRLSAEFTCGQMGYERWEMIHSGKKGLLPVLLKHLQ